MTALTPHLGTIDQVFQKVLRERHRTWRARDSIHKADHFYNFCITAYSLRDCFFEHKGWGGDRENQQKHCAERQAHHTEWNLDEAQRAVQEIANSAKHFSLYKPPQTKATKATTGAAVDVYVQGGELSCVEVAIPDFLVTMASGEQHHLWELMSEVTEYWRQFLTDAGIPLADNPHYFPDSVPRPAHPGHRR